MVPGGARSAAAWAEIVGVSPDKGSEFFEKLMLRDDGWLASLYDSLARIHGPVAGVPDRSGAHEAVLHRYSRAHHNARPGAAGVPLQHGNDAAYDAAAYRCGREGAYPGRHRIRGESCS